MKRALLLLLVLAAGVALFIFLQSGLSAPSEPITDVDHSTTTDAGDEFNLLTGDEHSTDGDGGVSGATKQPQVAQVLRGIVESTDQRPIANAVVMFAVVDPQRLRGAPFEDPPPFATANTERDGTFEVEDAPTGRWITVTASAPGYATNSTRIADRAVFARVQLPQAGTLTVRIVDATDSVIPDAEVEVTAMGTPHRAKTNAQGDATFEALAPGAAALRATAEGFARVTAPSFAIAPGANAAQLMVLPRSIRVAGIVVDAADGAPIAGASVYVSLPGRSIDAGLTDAQGTFAPVFAGGPGERQFLSVEAEGFAPALEPVVLRTSADGKPMRMPVRMKRAKPWRGRVEQGGRPVAGARVAFTPDGVADREPQATLSDEGGWFTLPPPRPPVPGRRAVLFAEHAGAQAARVIRAGDVAPTPLTLALVNDVTVYGRVVDKDPERRAGAQVRLQPIRPERRPSNSDPVFGRMARANEGGNAAWTTATGSQGHWRIEGVPPGSYRVQVRTGAHVVWMPDVVEVEDSDVYAGAFRPSDTTPLTGLVSDTRGRPLAGVQVRVTTTGKDVRRSWVPSNEQGEFAFELPPGTYRVQAMLTGYQLIDVPSVTLTDQEADVSLTMAAGGGLTVRLSNADGSPWNGVAQIRLQRPGSARATQPPRAVRITKGQGALAGVPSGRYEVEARAPGLLALSSDPVSIDTDESAEVRLTWAPTATIEGQVVVSGGAGSAGARVDLVLRTSGLRLLATADEDGRFVLQDARPGTYAYAAFGPGGAPTQGELDVAPGKTAKVTITLEAGGAADVRVLGPNGRAVRNARVVFRSLAGLVRSNKPAKTNEDGHVVRDGLPQGSIEVQARDEAGNIGRGDVNIVTGQTATVVVRLQPRVTESAPR